MQDQHSGTHDEPDPATVRRRADQQPVTDSLRALVDDMRGVRQGGEILLLLGEADPSVFCTREFLDAARFASEVQHATISAITGPVLLVPDGWGKQNALVKAHREGWIRELRHRTARFGLFHFRVVDTDGTPYFFYEFPHPPAAPEEARSCLRLEALSEDTIRVRAEAARETFDLWRRKSVTHDDAITRDRLLASTPTKIARLVERVEATGRDFDLLDAAAIRAAAAEVDMAGAVRPYRSAVRKAVSIPIESS